MGNEASELAELRRRAYGPNPDINDDPAALARLEFLLRPADRAPKELPLAASNPGLVGMESVTTTVQSRMSPRIVLAWITSLIAVSVVSVAATVALLPKPPEPDAVLAQVPIDDRLAAVVESMGEVKFQFEAFHGMVALMTESDGVVCIGVTAEPEFAFGRLGGTCVNPGLTPFLDVTLYAGMTAPPEMLEYLSDGRTVRFTLVDGVIEVDEGQRIDGSIN